MTSRNRPEGKGDGRLLTATPDGSEAGPATRAIFDGVIGGLNPPPTRKFLTSLLLLKNAMGGRLSMYLCISTVVDFNSQKFAPPPLMKFDKYSPAGDRIGFYDSLIRTLSVNS